MFLLLSVKAKRKTWSFPKYTLSAWGNKLRSVHIGRVHGEGEFVQCLYGKQAVWCRKYVLHRWFSSRGNYCSGAFGSSFQIASLMTEIQPQGGRDPLLRILLWCAVPLMTVYESGNTGESLSGVRSKGKITPVLDKGSGRSNLFIHFFKKHSA